jgi:hypothetical protein
MNMPPLEQIIAAMLGKRVKIWTRFIEAPEVGILIFFGMKPPYLALIKDDNGKYHIYNWKEIVKIDCLDEIKI